MLNCVNCWEVLNSRLNHNVTGNGERDGLKIKTDWTISSQATWEQVEGSTTRVWSPERTVKPHECAAPNVGEDIVYSIVKAVGRDKEPAERILKIVSENVSFV